MKSLSVPPQVTKADRVRERELLRYYRPSEPQSKDASAALQASSPDTTLTAFAQLVAIRLDVKSVLINVITKDTQYTISEATRTVNLANTTVSEKKGDALWIGCGSIGKSSALCEHTIALPSFPGGTHPFFTVPDLSQDDRFKDYFYVKGDPKWRFYSGCPLTTKKSLNIGAVCILDDKPRPGLTPDQEEFVATVSQTIMRHLEMKREAEERKKGTRMSRGLNAFVEGKTSVTPEDFLGNIEPLSSLQSEEGTRSPRHRPHQQSSSSTDPPVTAPSQRQSSVEPSGTSSPSRVGTETSHRDIAGQQRQTFSRAANLLRQSLDLLSGGVVFLDTVIGFTAGDRDTSTDSTSSEENSGQETVDVDLGKPSPKRTAGRYNVSSFESSLKPENNKRTAGVLGKCTTASFGPESSNSATFKGLGERALAEFVKQYPRGKLWSFDEDGSFSSSDDDLEPKTRRKARGRAFEKRLQRKKAEAKLLQISFPGVRQLLFCPLWNAGSARFFSGCFAWSTSALQIFSDEMELSFLSAFGNSVMAEVSRLDTIAADQQKGDFIGSISHELRSPLHGILASAEFLGETDCDSFQRSLVDTIDSCGRTLLDTINHVLDFSKINAFERNLKKKNVNRANSVTSSGRLPQMPQILNIYAVTDVAAICEEVVEGVYAGQVYQDINSADLAADMTPGMRGRTFQRSSTDENRSSFGGTGSQYASKAVDVVLDIEPGDYTFTTQPGALRRVIMNLVTNSLKYTERGMVLIKLSLHTSRNSQDSEQVEDNDNEKLLELIVRDTGKGISADYLRTRLFTPFAQENTLAPGTGLGLSLVRSITNMLGGSIDVKSEVGLGTEVKIQIPLLRVTGTDTPISTPNTQSSLERTQDDSIGVLQSEAPGMTVAFYGFEPTAAPSTEVALAEMDKVLKQYITKWYGLRVFKAWQPSKKVDFIIVDEKNLPDLVLRSTAPNCSIIALSTNASRHVQSSLLDIHPGIELLFKPFGPFKLAKALRSALERKRALAAGFSTVFSPPTDMSGRKASGTPNEPPVLEFEAVTLASESPNAPINVQTTTEGNITAGDTENALMAVENASIGGSTSTEKASIAGFPFPDQSSDASGENRASSRPSGFLVRKSSSRPALTHRKTEPTSYGKSTWDGFGSPMASKPGSPTHERKASFAAQPVRSPGPQPAPQTPGKRPPRILLVDDNKINLRLLKTFMMKREYQLVDSADNGHSAVQAAESQKDGYDVIFMDISMPVMNGFEATRAIRLIEETRRTGGSDDNPPALIIALTGLASSRDQSEAFTSGVDLFMTKPVSFKEVGRLLDNWEANGGSQNITKTGSVKIG